MSKRRPVDPDKTYYQTCDCCGREFVGKKRMLVHGWKVNRVCPHCGYDNTKGSEIARAYFSGEFARRRRQKEEAQKMTDDRDARQWEVADQNLEPPDDSYMVCPICHERIDVADSVTCAGPCHLRFCELCVTDCEGCKNRICFDCHDEYGFCQDCLDRREMEADDG